MRRAALAAALLIALACGAAETVRAQNAAPATSAPPRAEVTKHTVTLADGETLAYTATAGTLPLRNDRGDAVANVFYVAYVTGDRKRPVTFLYNGGPGAASLWLHIGAFGPRRLGTSPSGLATPATTHIADNPWTLLDVSDLVFIDAVGTGYSTVTSKGTSAQFWGVDEDINAFDQFIKRWVTANDRVQSPKFLLGESYGTFRSAGLADKLQRDGVPVNGIVLLSSLLNYGDDFGTSGDENISDALAIPSEAAVAWYHKKTPAPPADLAPFLAAARAFTNDEFLPYLLRPAAPDAERNRKIADRLHAFIGLAASDLLSANARVSTSRFEEELLAGEGKITGRYDGRFTGPAGRRGRGQSDPSYDAFAPAFTAAFGAYLKTDLNWPGTQPYRVLPGEIVANWNFRRSGFSGRVLAPTVIPDLRHALESNPNLRVFAGSGLFDLATPFYATEYELANVGLAPAVYARITQRLYPTGHMIYMSEDALRTLRGDLDRFYAGAIPRSPAEQAARASLSSESPRPRVSGTRNRAG